MTCPGGKACTHGDAALRHDASASRWESKCKGKVCCLKCDKATRSWSPCERMCAAAQKRRSEANAKEKAANEKRAEKELRKNYARLRATCERMVRAADAAGLDDKVRANDGYSGGGGHEVGLLRRYARGEWNEGERPYFYDFELEKCSTLAKCAQTLHCTTDYLLGLTEELTPQPITAFVDGAKLPPRDGEYYCRFDGCGTSLYVIACWDGALKRWKFKNSGCEIEAMCLGWYPLPKKS